MRASAVVDREPGLKPPGPTAGSQATVVSTSAHSTVLQVDARADGIVVLSEVCYPGWRAWVDGQRAPDLCADGILQGIPVRAGKHDVELRYAPASFRLGLLLSCLTALALLGVWLFPLVKPRTRMVFPNT